MIYHHERLVHGNVASEHIVQQFDDIGGLTETVARFLDEGRREGANLLVVARHMHWDGISDRLDALGAAVDEMIRRRQLVVLDAATTLATFFRYSQPEPERFDGHLGGVVRELAAQGRLRIYDEMADVLAEQGSYAAAEEVEDLWNRLAQRCSFQILCGYASSRFTDRYRETALDAILGVQPRIDLEPTDVGE